MFTVDHGQTVTSWVEKFLIVEMNKKDEEWGWSSN